MNKCTKPRDKIVCTIGLDKYNRLDIQSPPKKKIHCGKDDKNSCTIGLDKYNRLNIQWPPVGNVVGIKDLKLKSSTK